MRGIMEQEIRLLCSGYGAETGSDLLAVKLLKYGNRGSAYRSNRRNPAGRQSVL